MCSKLQRPITLHWNNIFLWIFFLNESSWKALSERLEIKNFENSPFLTLADTLKNELLWQSELWKEKEDVYGKSC